MRILAVRGHDLASLAEPFAVELAAEPLEGAGLFAITGETGSGKSTLLDALCLALYGDFPRVADGADQDVPDVADQTVKAKDPRNILRKGASRGEAEVDFVGVDGRTYRATWSVHRARGRPGGQLQPARHLLVRLDDEGRPVETLADKTGAVKARVVDLTDLTFAQFRRTAVLAQGEFDAFLRADDADRADLLEKITGTEIYARLSVAAHEAHRAAREAVERARERLAALGLAAPEARAEKEARRAAVEADLDGLRPRLAAATDARAAHDRLDRAVERAAATDTAARAARDAFEAATPERERFDAIERARTLRPAVDALRACRRDEAEAIEALAEAGRRLEVATPRFREAGAARLAAQEAVKGLDADIVDWRPQWDAATRLDVRLAEASRRVEEAEAPARVAAETVAAIRGDLDRISHRRGEIAAHLARLAADRDRHPELAPVVEHWREIAERFEERTRIRRDAAAAAAEVADAVEAIAAATTRLDALETAEAERRAARAEAEGRLEAARTSLLAAREDEARVRDDAFARLGQRVAETLPLLRERTASAASAAEAAEEEVAARADRDRHAAERPGLVVERDELARRLAEGAAADRLARAIDSREALALRGDLVDGAPCPVCGATDHPILADPTIRAALADLRAERDALARRAAEVGERLAESDRARAVADARAADAAGRRDEARARHAAAEAAVATADAEVAAIAGPLGLDWAALGVDAAARLEAASAALRTARAPLAERLAAAGEARAEIDAVRAVLDALETARAGDAEAVRAADDIRNRADRRAAVAGETERSARARLDEIDARLAVHLSPLGIGPTELDDGGDTIVARLAATIAARRTADAEAIALAEEEKAQAVEEMRLRDALARAESDRVGADTTLADRRAAAVALAAERADLLGGEATEPHRARIEEQRRIAVVQLETATAALAEATREHDAAMGQIGERRARLARAEAETARAAGVCERALAKHDLDWERAAALLAVPDDEVDATRARLAALAEAANRAAGEAAARQGDLDAARAETAGLAPRAEVEAAIAAEADRLDALNRELGALRETLAADDLARARAEAVAAEIVGLEEEAAVWAAVAAAVGSADGAKFRRYAQGVTLDRLAALADRHLATLAPRYRLVRTDGLGLAIVDRDMGDERRSTRSLSGGERFLASLALALALSGLEGRRSFVDTLFIDEGFGSLDAATLDVAIDALESLQSEGRRVGVISHVAAMHERIPVQIRVVRAGLGISRVTVVDAGRERT